MILYVKSIQMRKEGEFGGDYAIMSDNEGVWSYQVVAGSWVPNRTA